MDLDEATGPETEAVETTQADTPEPKAEAPEAEGEAPETDAAAEGELEGDGEGEGDQTADEEAEPEEIEFDFGGNKLSVPKDQIPPELAEKVDKFARGIWSDFTRKSQEVAEARKHVEAQKEAVDKLHGMTDEMLGAYARGLNIRSELEQLSHADLSTLWQSDPDRARQLSDRITQKQAEFQKVVAEVSKHEQAIAEAQKQERAQQEQARSQQMERGRQAVERVVKGFSARVPEVVEYVSATYGIPKDVAERDWPLNPATAVMAYKAMLYDRMQTKAAAKVKAPAPAKPASAPVKPVSKGTGGKTVIDPDKLPPDQWLKWREKQLAAKRAS